MKDPDFSKAAKPIFIAALRLPDGDARKRYLNEACDGDARLRAYVASLLEAHRHAATCGAHSFLEHAVDVVAPSASLREFDISQVEDIIGDTVGPYRIVEHLAEGGMGVVYVAQQVQPVRRLVALKVIKPGMDSKQIIARFEAERQALALMDHPNIAKVLDGGTTGQGRLYFVMELVNGVPITQFCDQHELDAKARLRLFVAACRAVQHAHLKGIIHRDIKPSNVMVQMCDGVPVPKVIDFGVAKAINQRLSDSTIHTLALQTVGTPLYMSPEQTRGASDDIDTRADVYSLGVLLYELLTGSTPLTRDDIQDCAPDDVWHMIRAADPPRPSQRVSALDPNDLQMVSRCRRIDSRHLLLSMRRDLDWIVMKAIEKDRSRRYESASDLADDVERFLTDQPVNACPPSLGYRIGKLGRRHRSLFAASVVVMLVLVGGAAGVLWYAGKATVAARNATNALANVDRLIRVANFERSRAQTMLYAADIQAVSRAIANGDVRRADELLTRHQEDGNPKLCGFEWFFYQQCVARPDHITLPQTGWVNSVAMSPDGGRLAVTADDGVIRFYESRSWQLQRTWVTERQSVNGMAWSSDGTYLAAACTEGEVLVWHASRHELVHTLAAHKGEANGVAFSPDGSLLYSCGDDHLAKSWVVATGKQKQVFSGHQREVEQLALAADGAWLATASSDDTVALWDTRTGVAKHRIQFSNGRAISVAISRNGRYMAAGNIYGDAQLFDIEANRYVELPPQFDGIESLVFYGDDQWLVTADRGGVIHLHSVPELMDGSADTTHDTHPSWNAHDGRVTTLAAMRRAGKLVSGGRDGKVHVWSPNIHHARVSIDREDGRTDSCAAGNDHVLVAGSSIEDWDLQRMKLVKSFAASKPRWLCVASSGNGKYAVAARVGELVVFALTSYQPIARWTLDGTVDPHCLALAHDGRSVVVADWTEREFVTLYRCGQEEPIGKIKARQCECLAFAPDDGTLAVGNLDELLLYDVAAGHYRSMRCQHTDTLSGVAFSPDGQTLATVGHDRLLKVWDLHTGQQLSSIVAHDDWVRSVAYSPDGRTIATSGDDQTVRIWHAVTRQPMGIIVRASHNIEKVFFSTNGMHLVADVTDNPIIVCRR